MASADRKHLIAACVAAIDLQQQLPPNARLWLARASLHADPKGRTGYGPHRYATDTNDTPESGQRAIDWLLANAVISHDHNDDGVECWRLTHHDWDREDTIGGYSRDAGQKRDGLPPQYGRRVDDVIEPPTGNRNFTPPAWDEIRDQILRPDDQQQEAS